MHATVTDALFEALPRHGIATVRFNFRGVGASGGEHDDGLGERLDIVAAIELLAMFVDEPIVLVGLLVRRRRLAVRRRHRASPAGTRSLRRCAPSDDRDFVAANDPRPKRLAVARARSVQPPGRAREPRPRTGATPSSTVIPGGDHFLSGRLALVAEGCVDFVRALS